MAVILPDMSRRAILLLCLLPGLALTGGCAGQKPEPAVSPGPERLASDQAMPPVEQAERAQRVLRRQIGPAVRVGYVSETMDGPVLRILGVESTGLRSGGSFLFLDATRRPIAYGTILEVSTSGVRASFDATLIADGRPPRPGDLAAFNLQSPPQAASGS